MRQGGRYHRVLGAATAIALLAGCAGGTRSTPLTSGIDVPSAANSPAAVSKLLYIARYSYHDVQVYDSRTLALVRTLSGFVNPQGVALDKRRNVYVVDQGANVVSVFHRGATTPFETLADPDGIELQVVVGNDGTVYLSNEYDLQLGNGNVVEYAPGKTKPSRLIGDPHFNTVEDVGLDSHNNLYVTFDDEHVVGHVNEYSPGSTNGKRLPISLGGIGGIELDSTDDLLVVDTRAGDVKVFAQGSGSPKYEFGQGQSDPWDIALARHSTRAFVTDPYSGNTYEYALPRGKRLHVVPNPSNTTGVAVEQ